MFIKKNLLLKEKSFFQILLIIFCLLPLFSGISSIPPLDRDESRFAQSSYQMLHNNDYINIKFQDEIRAKNLRAFIGFKHFLRKYLVQKIFFPTEYHL